MDRVNERVKQIRTNALVAEYTYSVRISRLNAFRLLVDILTIILPILFMAVLLVIKGTEYETIGNIISILLSALLLGLKILSILLKFDDKKIQYHIGKRNNIYVAEDAQKLMLETDEERLNWFYTYVAEMDSRDSDAIGRVSERLRRKAYRMSLMKLVPGSAEVVCPICHGSPFQFKRGSCKLCGNKPKQ